MKSTKAASEHELLRLSRRGNEAAFAALIARYEDKIFRLAKNVCSGLPSESEDVYQETFLTAFEKLKTFRENANLGSWLYRIASNLCFMRYRKKKNEPFVPLLDGPSDEHRRGGSALLVADPAPSPDEAARKKELVAAVADALESLPIEYRLAVILRDVEGLSNEAAAKTLRVSVAAVKSRLHRGRSYLRDAFRRGSIQIEPE